MKALLQIYLSPKISFFQELSKPDEACVSIYLTNLTNDNFLKFIIEFFNN